MIDKNALSEALAYAERGISVIPVRPDKKPYLFWAEYQTRRAEPEEIKLWFNKWPNAGVGIVTGKISGVVVVDCDTEEGVRTYESMLPNSLLTPVCRTQSGGVHYYHRHPGEKISNATRNLPGCDLRGDGGYAVAPPTVGKKGTYEWHKGLSLAEVPLSDLPAKYLEATCRQSISYNNSCTLIGDVDNAPAKRIISFEHGCRDESLFNIANTLTKGGMPPENIAKVLESIIKSWGEKPSPQWIADKIKSALSRLETADRNLTGEIREWVLSTSGVFLSTDVYRELNLSTRVHMKTASTALSRICEEGLIERHSNKRGCFRIIDRSEDVVDILAADDVEDLGIEFPLNLHERFETPPSSPVILAGASNAGKTAFLLETAYRNRNRLETFYFSSSSETNPKTLRKRIKTFGYPLEDWKAVNFRSKRGGNFADVIRPDGLNIIDYLEVHRDFYEVGERIAEIAERLKDGVAVIGLQKKQGEPFAKGGEMTREKATTYINLDLGSPQKMSFQKIKYPKGKGAYDQISFKIINNGSRFQNYY